MTIIDEKYSWHTKPVCADKTNILTLGCENVGNTDGTDFKQITTLPEVLRVDYRSDLDRPVTTADFIASQANDPYCNQIASLVDRPGSVNLDDSNSILVRQSISPVLYKKFYLLHFLSGFCILGIFST